MTDIIEFFFDFASPYGYFASHKVEAVAAKQGRRAVWKPIMIGAAFKETGNAPLVSQPIKGAYARHDWERMGRYMEVPWVFPDPFPVAALAPSRAFYWIDDQDKDRAKDFARAAYHAYFGEGRDISQAEEVIRAAAPLGLDEDALRAAMDDPAIKERLKAETTAAIERGVFGSPFFIVDGEGYWGSDRMWMIKKQLQDKKWTDPGDHG